MSLLEGAAVVLIDLNLRATFSPAQPLARRDKPLAQARAFLGRAFREQEDDQAAPFFFLAGPSPYEMPVLISPHQTHLFSIFLTPQFSSYLAIFFLFFMSALPLLKHQAIGKRPERR